MAAISLFPKYNYKKDDGLFEIEEPCLYYTRDNRNYRLECVSEGNNVYSIKDPIKYWNIDTYNIIAEWNIFLNSSDSFFGENGYACKNAMVGIGIIWSSKTSNRRGAFKIGSFSYKESNIPFKYNTSDYFSKACLKGEIEFRTVLYIESPGNPNSKELHLANKQGMIVGELGHSTFILDGDASLFPIYNVSLKGEPLWNVSINYEDPNVDLFSECISINLNTANPCYKYIDRSSDDFNCQMLIEVMGAAICVIIENLRKNDSLFVSQNTAFQEGSISQAVNFFKNHMNFDFSSPEQTSISIRKFLETNLKL